VLTTGIEQAADEETPAEVATLRENADIRETLITAGTATPEECDSILLWSHEELDQLAEEGLLEESAAHAAAFFGGLAGAAKFDPEKHPRGRGGRFSEVLNKIMALRDGDRQHLGNGVHAKNVGGKTQILRDRRVLSTHTTHDDAARSAVAAMDTPRKPRARRSGDARFEHGDQVEITKGQHKGESGSVLHHHEVSNEVAVDTGEHVRVVHGGHVRKSEEGGAAGPDCRKRRSRGCTRSAAPNWSSARRRGRERGPSAAS
jgi:hypothetical protein